MSKPIEFCPNCNCKRELDRSLGLVSANASETDGYTLLYHFHCAACNSYVRSTTLDYQEFIQADELLVLSQPVYIW